MPAWLTPRAAAALVPISAILDQTPGVVGARRPEQAFEILTQDLGDGFAREHFYAARHGLEVRYPYRDQALVELMLGARDSHLYDRGTTRPILRRAVADLLPPSILARETKATFEPWLRSQLATSTAFRRLLNAADPAWSPWVDPHFVAKALASERPTGAELFLLWNCATFESWRKPPAEPTTGVVSVDSPPSP